MGSRYLRCGRKEKLYDITIDTLVERLKKMRALNCNPTDVGIDTYVWKRISLNRMNRVMKVL